MSDIRYCYHQLTAHLSEERPHPVLKFEHVLSTTTSETSNITRAPQCIGIQPFSKSPELLTISWLLLP